MSVKTEYTAIDIKNLPELGNSQQDDKIIVSRALENGKYVTYKSTLKDSIFDQTKSDTNKEINNLCTEIIQDHAGLKFDVEDDRSIGLFGVKLSDEYHPYVDLSGFASVVSCTLNEYQNMLSHDNRTLYCVYEDQAQTMDDIYPVGTIYMTTLEQNPKQILHIGNWSYRSDVNIGSGISAYVRIS